MKFARTYSAPGDPYAGVKFEPRSSRIVNPDGSVIFEAKDVMVPASWSQVAVDVLAQKYCRKAGVPKATTRVEEKGVPELAPTFDRRRTGAGGSRARRAIRGRARRAPGLQPDGGMLDVLGLEARLFRFRKRRASLLRRDVRDARAPDRCAELAAMVQYRIALGVRYLRAPARALVRRSGRRHCKVFARYVYASRRFRACYIFGIEDDLVNEGGIFDGVMREARIFKGGSGCGANFSKIRAAGRKTYRRRNVERSHVVPQGIRSRRRRDQVRRDDSPRGQDGGAQRRPSRYRRVCELEGPRRA